MERSSSFLSPADGQDPNPTGTIPNGDVGSSPSQHDPRVNGGSSDTETSSPDTTPSLSSPSSNSSSNPFVSVSLPRIDVFAPPRKKRRTGLVVVLCLCCALVLGITAASVWVLATYGLPGQDGFRAEPPAAESSPEPGAMPTPPLPETEEQSVATYRPPAGSEVTLAVNDAPRTEPLSLGDIYDKCIPSVVSISATSSSSISLGTGIIMTEDGYIITNNHIISGGTTLTVTLQDNTEYPAALVGVDGSNDLAVLKIDARGLAAAEFGNSDALRVGDTVVAIGNPTSSEALRGTMTDGIISAIDRSINVDGYMLTLIQTNAALNSGNSGGPLINTHGQVIGINILKFVSSANAYEGLGFSIPISVAKPIIDELIANGRITGRPSIGIMSSTLPAEAAAYYGMPQGVLVHSIDERSHAYTSGLQPGDLIVAFNGEAVVDNTQLGELRNNFRAGDEVTLTVWREGEYLEIAVILCEESDLTG